MKSIYPSNYKIKNRGIAHALCFLILVSVNIYAESVKDTIIETKEISIDPLNRSSISDNQFAFITSNSWNIKKRELFITNIDLKTFTKIKIKVLVPTSIKILQCPSFCLNDSFMLIQDEYDLEWFLFKNVSGEFKLIEKIILPSKTKAFDARVLNNHMFLFSDLYNHHPKDSLYNTSLCVFDARSRKIMKVIHPELPCIGLSHFPQNWISQNRELIALADPCGNKIRIYDFQLSQIRTIQLPTTSTWINLPGNKIPIETSPSQMNPKELIEKFGPMLSTFSRIETIHFANDSLLLISCNETDTANYENLNFVYNAKINAFISSKSIFISEKRKIQNSGRSELTFQLNPHQMIRNGICISLEEDNFIPNPTLTAEENEINKNKFYENNDPEFIIRISKIEIK